MLDVAVPHLVPLRHQGSPGVERFQVVEKYKEFVPISSKSGADRTSHKDRLALERGRTATVSPQKICLWEGSGIAVLTTSRAVLLCAQNSSKILAQAWLPAGQTQLWDLSAALGDVGRMEGTYVELLHGPKAREAWVGQEEERGWAGQGPAPEHRGHGALSACARESCGLRCSGEVRPFLGITVISRL